MNIGTLFRARVLKNVFGGDAMAKVAGEVVFAQGLIAGEEFVGEVTAARKDYSRAVVKELLQASPDRVAPACPGMGRCPGCAYGHCAHAAEQRMKLAQLRDFLKPLGVAPEMVAGHGLEASPAEHYRNKIKLQMRKSGGEPQLGYVFTDGRMYPVRQCLLAGTAINETLETLYHDPGFVPSLHDRMTLTVRESADGVIYFRNAPGRDVPLLRERVLDRDFMVPPDGFFQVNAAGLQALIELVTETLREREYTQVIDAYAGAGLFGAVAAAAGVATVAGIELDAAAGRAAQSNWRNFGARNIDFRAGDAGVLLPELLSAAGPGTLAIFDPPRGGLDGKAVRALGVSSLREMICISCHPATLVRDLGRLAQSGFRIEKVRYIDMFPRSGHFETFTKLVR